MPLPAFVRQDDGRLEPFDPDRLYRRLFAAAESAGYADPLAAREVTDAVLYFIGLENDGLVLSFIELKSRVETVLREMQQAPVLAALTPQSARFALELAQRWHFQPTRPLSDAELANPKYDRYGRALARAEELELLELDSVGTADGLAALVRRLPPRGTEGLEFVEELRALVTGVIAFDAPDLEACLNAWTVREARAFFEEVAWAAAIHGLTVELHLGSCWEPAWSELTPGPLYHRHVDPADLAQRALLRRTLMELVLDSSARLWSGLKLVWHVAPGVGDDAALLLRLAKAALSGGPVEFIIDHRRDDVLLAAGTSRRRPALLQTITFDLATLSSRQQQPLSFERFVGKCESLVRLAASAASRKRERLREDLATEAAFFVEMSQAAIRASGVSEALQRFQPGGEARLLGRGLRAALKEETLLRSLGFVTELQAGGAAPNHLGFDYASLSVASGAADLVDDMLNGRIEADRITICKKRLTTG